MTRRANPFAVGVFVLGALVLAAGGVVVLTKSWLFGRSNEFVIYFSESVRGLTVGSPVAYLGVTVGEVTSVVAGFSLKQQHMIAVPVTIRINPDAVLIMDRDGATEGQILQRMIDAGLRAQLQLQSIVTAQLYIALDYAPGQPAVFRHENRNELREIPSIPGPLTNIQRSIDELALATPDLLAEVKQITQAVAEILAGDSADDLRRVLRSAANLAEKLGDPAGPLIPVLERLPDTQAQLASTLEEARTLMVTAKSLTDDVKAKLDTHDEQVGDLLVQLTRTAVSAQRAADQASTLIAQNRDGIRMLTTRGIPQILGLVEDTGRTVNELNGLLRDFRQNPAGFFLGDEVRQGVKLR